MLSHEQRWKDDHRHRGELDLLRAFDQVSAVSGVSLSSKQVTEPPRNVRQEEKSGFHISCDLGLGGLVFPEVLLDKRGWGGDASLCVRDAQRQRQDGDEKPLMEKYTGHTIDEVQRTAFKHKGQRTRTI